MLVTGTSFPLKPFFIFPARHTFSEMPKYDVITHTNELLSYLRTLLLATSLTQMSSCLRQ
jgi:hypothetical protein